MVSTLLLDPEIEEAEQFREDVRYLTALSSDEKIDFWMLSSGENIQEELRKIDVLHMALIDVTSANGVEASKEIRCRFPEVQILVIADAAVSPAAYLTPKIRPSALLLRPYEERHKYQVLRDFFFFAVRPLLQVQGDYYWAKTKDGTQKIPYSAILYFEAREKRVFIRTKTIEYGIGGTIERILEKLPQNFIRCHRSFVVNKDYIERIRLAESAIYLTNSVMIPISRSYKTKLKEYSVGNRLDEPERENI